MSLDKAPGRVYIGTMNTETPGQTVQMDPSYRVTCFACGKTIRTKAYVANTRDDQLVYVGSDCWKHIKASGETGYQNPAYMYVGDHAVKIYPT